MRLRCLDVVEQIKHGQAKRVCNDLNRVERRVSLTGLDAAQKGLVKAAFLAEFHLAHPDSITG